LSSSVVFIYIHRFLGGASNDFGYGIAVDSEGSAYIIGYTQSSHTASTKFPVTDDAFQTTYGGGDQDAFVAKFDTDGGLLYST
jgi:hypothetical protein